MYYSITNNDDQLTQRKYLNEFGLKQPKSSRNPFDQIFICPINSNLITSKSQFIRWSYARKCIKDIYVHASINKLTFAIAVTVELSIIARSSSSCSVSPNSRTTRRRFFREMRPDESSSNSVNACCHSSSGSRASTSSVTAIWFQTRSVSTLKIKYRVIKRII